MTIWFIIAVLCAGSAAALAFGAKALGKRLALDSATAEVTIYKDQLQEIEADLVRGVLGSTEADGQRTEVARRLLAAARPQQQAGLSSQSWIGVAAALAVPLLAFAVYAELGSPALQDVPQAARLAEAEKNNDLEAMVYKVEKHLAQKPDDATGWEILIPSYQAMGRFGDAAFAHRRIIAIKGPTADHYAGIAEMLMFQGNGLMPKEGAEAARAALALDPQHTKARYYNALGLAQEGKAAEALMQFERLLATAPADAPYRASVEREIAKLKSANATAPQLTDEQMQAAQGLSSDEQRQMIRSMVDGLAEKLKAEPKNLEGWLRLIRARVVLKDVEAAQTSLVAARAALAGNAAGLLQLDALAKELNLP